MAFGNIAHDLMCRWEGIILTYEPTAHHQQMVRKKSRLVINWLKRFSAVRDSSLSQMVVTMETFESESSTQSFRNILRLGCVIPPSSNSEGRKYGAHREGPERFSISESKHITGRFSQGEKASYTHSLSRKLAMSHLHNIQCIGKITRVIIAAKTGSINDYNTIVDEA